MLWRALWCFSLKEALRVVLARVEWMSRRVDVETSGRQDDIQLAQME